MKKKKSGGFLIAFLLTLAVLGGWYVIASAQTNANAKNSSYQFHESDGTDGYKTVTMEEGSIHAGNLLLINPEHAYRFPENSELVSVFSQKNTDYKVKDKNVLLDTHVISALNRMMTDFNAEKSVTAVNVISGFRTTEDQARILEEEIAAKGEAVAAMWVAQPKFSEHHSGLALDLGLYFDDGTSSAFDGKGKYAWITENCWKYGFIVRYEKGKESITKISHEPWHLRYVGIPHAYMMQEKGFCMEEYIAFLRDSSSEQKHLSVSVLDQEYDIYYTDKSEISVPKSGDYEISGNNVDGYIVTISN